MSLLELIPQKTRRSRRAAERDVRSRKLGRAPSPSWINADVGLRAHSSLTGRSFRTSQKHLTCLLHKVGKGASALITRALAVPSSSSPSQPLLAVDMDHRSRMPSRFFAVPKGSSFVWLLSFALHCQHRQAPTSEVNRRTSQQGDDGDEICIITDFCGWISLRH